MIYLISPIDFIPEGIINHPIAFSDDMAIMLLIMKRGIYEGYVNPKMVQRFWEGDESFIENLALHYESMQNHLGSDFIEVVWAYLKSKLGRLNTNLNIDRFKETFPQTLHIC